MCVCLCFTTLPEMYSHVYVNNPQICALARALTNFVACRATDDESTHIPKRAVIKRRAMGDAEPEEGEVYDDSQSAADKARYERTSSAARNGKSVYTPALDFKIDTIHI